MFLIKGYLSDKIMVSIDQLYLIFSNRKIFGIRNLIERCFSGLKRRVKQLNICFLTYKLKVSEKWITSWVALS